MAYCAPQTGGGNIFGPPGLGPSGRADGDAIFGARSQTYRAIEGGPHREPPRAANNANLAPESSLKVAAPGAARRRPSGRQRGGPLLRLHTRRPWGRLALAARVGVLIAFVGRRLTSPPRRPPADGAGAWAGSCRDCGQLDIRAPASNQVIAGLRVSAALSSPLARVRQRSRP